MAYRNYAPANGYIVSKDGNGDFTTIGAALSAASTASFEGDIFIKPSSVAYTENLTLVPNINLVAWTSDGYTGSVTILGTLTASASGTCSISGIQLQTNSAAILNVTGSNTLTVNFINCLFNINNNTAETVNNANATINHYHCKAIYGTTGIAAFSVTTCTLMNYEYCYYGANTSTNTTANTIAAGEARLFFSRFDNPFSATGTASFTQRWSRIVSGAANVTSLTINTSGTCECWHNIYTSGTATTIIVTSGTLSLFESLISSTNTNAISGAGTLNYGGLSFTNTSAINVTTTNPMAFGVTQGGTGISTATANAPIVAGTTATGAFQVASTGLSNTGYVFTSTGSTSPPSFQALPSNTGGMPLLTYIGNATASSSANLSFTSLSASTYRGYRFYITSLLPAASSQLKVQLSSNNGSSYIATNYTNICFGITSGAALGTPSTVTTYFDVQNSVAASTGASSGIIDIYYQGNSNNMVTFQAMLQYSSGYIASFGFYAVQANINAIQFIQSSGNITSGTIYQFGIT